MAIIYSGDEDLTDEDFEDTPYLRRDDWECTTCGDTGWVHGEPCPDCAEDA